MTLLSVRSAFFAGCRGVLDELSESVTGVALVDSMCSELNTEDVDEPRLCIWPPVVHTESNIGSNRTRL